MNHAQSLWRDVNGYAKPYVTCINEMPSTSLWLLIDRSIQLASRLDSQ